MTRDKTLYAHAASMVPSSSWYADNTMPIPKGQRKSQKAGMKVGEQTVREPGHLML